ncbi:hypothetical protein I4U23_011069 [Adineta vaga]|nr:hypothetical protein I4U23_011069 [Adineta vaga]
MITVHVQTIFIKSPSFMKYSSLAEQTSLQCSCTKIAIKYKDFIKVESSYHELCQSDLISDEYIKQLYILYEKTMPESVSTDFHRIAVYQFAALRKLCQLTKETVENHLQTFLQTDFILSELISEQSLHIQITSL